MTTTRKIERKIGTEVTEEDIQNDINILKQKYNEDPIVKDITKLKTEVENDYDEESRKNNLTPSKQDIRKIYNQRYTQYFNRLNNPNAEHLYDIKKRAYITKLEELEGRLKAHKNKTRKNRDINPNKLPIRTGNANLSKYETPPLLSDTSSTTSERRLNIKKNPSIDSSVHEEVIPEGPIRGKSTEENSDDVTTINTNSGPVIGSNLNASTPSAFEFVDSSSDSSSDSSAVGDLKTPRYSADETTEHEPHQEASKVQVKSKTDRVAAEDVYPVSSQVSSIVTPQIKEVYSNIDTPDTSPGGTPRIIGLRETPTQTPTNSPVLENKQPEELDPKKTQNLRAATTQVDNKLTSASVDNTQQIYPQNKQGETTEIINTIKKNPMSSSTVNLYDPIIPVIPQQPNIPIESQQSSTKDNDDKRSVLSKELVTQITSDAQTKVLPKENARKLVSTILGNAIASSSSSGSNSPPKKDDNEPKDENICIYKTKFTIRDEGLRIKDDTSPEKLEITNLENILTSYSQDYSNQTECILLEAFIGTTREPMKDFSLYPELNKHADKFNKLYYS